MRGCRHLALVATLAMGGGAVAASHAAEADYKLTACGQQTAVMLQSGPDLTVFSAQARYAIAPPAVPKVFDNIAGHCVGYFRITDGKFTHMGSCRWTDPDGDTFIGESVMVPDKPGVWTFLSGTGKWKGISATGTWSLLNMSKPDADGSQVLCQLMTGKYAVP